MHTRLLFAEGPGGPPRTAPITGGLLRLRGGLGLAEELTVPDRAYSGQVPQLPQRAATVPKPWASQEEEAGHKGHISDSAPTPSHPCHL